VRIEVPRLVVFARRHFGEEEEWDEERKRRSR
jgi:hypothetical protein